MCLFWFSVANLLSICTERITNCGSISSHIGTDFNTRFLEETFKGREDEEKDVGNYL